MGKVKNLIVTFERGIDGNVPVYFSGETVSGKVILVLSGEIKVKSLSVLGRGEARVRWEESSGTGSDRDTQTYTQVEEYFNQKYYLLGYKKDGTTVEDTTTLHPGHHEFAFNFQLPQKPLVPSFKGVHGSVSYWVQAKLCRPWHLADQSRVEFTVFQHVDINNPALLSPQMGTKEKTLGCLCCTSGPISLNVRIARKAYTPGESIQIFAEIQNCSSRTVVPKAAIFQIQTFHAEGNKNISRQSVAKLKGESVSPGKTETWNGMLLQIPPVVPSLLNCSIIFVEYSLRVSVEIPRAVNLFVDVPLVIGTIPLSSFLQSDIHVEPFRSVYN